MLFHLTGLCTVSPNVGDHFSEQDAVGFLFFPEPQKKGGRATVLPSQYCFVLFNFTRLQQCQRENLDQPRTLLWGSSVAQGGSIMLRHYTGTESLYPDTHSQDTGLTLTNQVVHCTETVHSWTEQNMCTIVSKYSITTDVPRESLSICTAL